jgi:hypothetical protein
MLVTVNHALTQRIAANVLDHHSAARTMLRTSKRLGPQQACRSGLRFHLSVIESETPWPMMLGRESGLTQVITLPQTFSIANLPKLVTNPEVYLMQRSMEVNNTALSHCLGMLSGQVKWRARIIMVKYWLSRTSGTKATRRSRRMRVGMRATSNVTPMQW